MRERNDVGPNPVPRDFLESLLSRLHPWHLCGREWAAVIAVSLATGPITASQVGKQLRLKYCHAKAVARSLVKLGVLQRTRDGLIIQPDSNLWGPPVVPARRSAQLGLAPKMGGSIRPTGSPKEVVLE